MSKPGRNWIRVDRSIRDNIKLHALVADDRWDWLELLTVAGEEGRGGRLPPINHVAFLMRLSITDTLALYERLENARLIDRVNGGTNGWEYALHHWGDWQYESDSSTPRSQRSRNAARARDTEQSRAESKENTKEKAGNGSGQIDRFNLPADKLAKASGFDHAMWQTLLNEGRNRGRWNPLAGPKPGEDGCLAPAVLVSDADKREARGWKIIGEVERADD